jgi:triosephosphate isomerase (TIM)
MNIPILAGNWKMNGSRKSIAALLQDLKSAQLTREVEMAVFPPFPYLQQTSDCLASSAVVWGAQDLSVEDQGAFTGEVSAAMLVDFQCRFVIVGHSERRLYHGESDILAAQKCEKALEYGLTPILCVGETQEEKQNGLTEPVIERQLSAVLSIVGVEAFAKAVIAYEPVWAIGTGLSASCEDAESVHAFLKYKISEKSAIVSKKVRVLYGGSLKASNAAQLFAMPNIDGGLVGGASLNSQEFLQLAEILALQKQPFESQR